MITYPSLRDTSTIGVTAPSSGVPAALHELLHQARARMEKQGYRVVWGDTVWTQDKAKSAPARQRAEEFNRMMQDDEIGIIIPPWGGELVIEIVDQIDYDQAKAKWVLGYSDTSVLLLALTLRTGIATAHGPNLVDMRGEYSDDTTAMWKSVLSTPAGASVRQQSSAAYQAKWDHANPTPCVFHLTESTAWRTVSNREEKMEGRLLGGCIDVIRHLIGTPYGDVHRFRNQYASGEPVIWYLENCELSAADLRRSLVHMKLAGWFDHCSGILFGRSAANHPVDNYTAEDVYRELSEELHIPIVYDIDCGHVPPQMTFINGAYAVVEAAQGQGTVVQYFT